MYQAYREDFCVKRRYAPRSKAEFGKTIRKAFPGLQVRRRGNGHPHVPYYLGLAPLEEPGEVAAMQQQPHQQGEVEGSTPEEDRSALLDLLQQLATGTQLNEKQEGPEDPPPPRAQRPADIYDVFGL